MDVRDAAARRLAGGSRTCKELKDYLLKKEFKEAEIDELIKDYIDYGYLDDERYCHEYFRYAFGKGKSKSRAFYDLRTKGISQSLIDIAYEEYEGDTDERGRAMEAAMKILSNAGIEDGDTVPEKILGRIGRNLSSKGYSSDIIYSIIGDLRR